MMRLFVLIFMVPCFTYGQDYNNGIKFERLIWEQAKEKARTENKFIFVDCFATWCGPCKLMDKSVYIVDSVGKMFNQKFISIKVQMDKTAGDNDYVRSWYEDAEKIKKEYEVDAFPSYLFFLPTGEIVHRAVGFKNPKDFITLAREAMDPSKQYYILMNDFKKGKRDKESMKKLALASKEKGDNKFALELANQYLNSLDTNSYFTTDLLSFIMIFNESKKAVEIAKLYKTKRFDNLTDSLISKENFSFFRTFPALLNSNDRFFSYFLKEGSQIDSLMQREGLSKALVEMVVTKEEVTNKLYLNEKPITKKPDWKVIHSQIKKKYGFQIADDIIAQQKSKFFYITKQWQKWASIFENKLKKYPPTTTSKSLHSWGDIFALNSYAWFVFLNCNDKKVLKKALNWSNLSIKLDSLRLDSNKLGLVEYLDTKANILYKLGRVKEAIKYEEEALKLDSQNAQKKGQLKGSNFDEFSATISKMKKSEPTWKKQ